jgi:exodeoxyribonuclease V alpha subunit
MSDSTKVQVRITSMGYQNPWKASMIGVSVNDEGVRNDAHKVFFITANKKLMPVDPNVGQIWKVYGHATTSKNERDGGYVSDDVRISASGMEFILPQNGEAFIRFIADHKDFRGIGDAKARRLWNLYREDVIPIIKSGDRKAFKGLISEDSITALFEGFSKYTALEHAVFFAQNGIPQNVIQRIFKAHKGDIKDRIQEDPYRLMSFGIPWSLVDEIALTKFNFAESAKLRLSAAIEACLSEESRRNGNTVISHQALHKALIKLLKKDELVSQALMQEHETGAFIVSKKGYHSSGMLVMESSIAKRLALYRSELPATCNIIATDSFTKAVDNLGFPPTDQQCKSVSNAHLNYTSVITGGAGTGKTTVLRLVTQTLKFEGVQIHCVAMSGRAAQRMAEATGEDALTIAKFLRNPPLRGDRPQMLVVDEASMLDVQTMYQIITHISPEVRLVLVGDADQLPPIGPGYVLRDIIDSNTVEMVELDVVKRQDEKSGIPDYSRSVRTGVAPDKLSSGSIKFHAVSEADIDATCIDLMSVDPDNTMIVAATYRSPNGGIDALNQVAQKTLNPGAKRWEFEFEGERRHLNIFKGDPVIFTVNNYEAGVQNGTLGRLTSLDQSDGSYGLVETTSGETVSITQSLLESLRPAWAISLHKAQGSQFKRVIVPLSSSRMIDRNWLYTAITRCELELHIVGSEDLFKKAVERESASSKRQTYLKELLEAEGGVKSLLSETNELQEA